MKKEDILVVDAEASDYKEAIEHAGNYLFKFVKKEGRGVLRLKKEVDFHRIDDIEQHVSTSLIFNLALKKDEEHVTFLQKFVLALGSEDGDFAKECLTQKKEEVAELFAKYEII